jgi:single-stranded DNA-binding protein
MNGNNIECAFIGRIAAEAIEVKLAKSGTAWCRFSVAIGSGDEAQWVIVAAFGDMAERAARELEKADRIYCEGSIKLDRWQKDGEQKSGLGVAAWKVLKLGQIGQNRPRREGENGEAELDPGERSRSQTLGERS